MKKIILLLIFLILPFIFSCNEIIKLPKNYNITYHLNNGEEDISLSILENEILEKIDDPIYNGYIFKGWYIDDTLLEEYNFNKKITSDLDLYAKWEKEVEVIESIVPVFTGLSINNTQNGRRAKNDDVTAEVEEYGGFANVNENIIINIHIDNPSEYVILRFILNGITYQSFQFEEGSTSSLIKLKINVGQIPGKKDFKIDEIKYVDDYDNLIKDVKMEGKKIISVGITYDILPECKEIKIQKTFQNLSIEILIEDYYEIANNNMYLYLFKDDILIERFILVKGVNNIIIDKLDIVTEYNIVISATYDCLNGQGRKSYTLHKESVTTDDLELITLKDFNVSYHTIEFNYSTDYKNSFFDKIELLRNTDNLKEKVFYKNISKIDSLNDNTTYKLVIYSHAFVNDVLIDRVYEYTFTTLEIPKPTLEYFKFTEITDTTVVFDYETSFLGGKDLYFEVIRVILIVDGLEVRSELTNRFEDLESDTNYIIKIHCIYGVNEQSTNVIFFEKEFKTLDIKPHLEVLEFFIQDKYVQWIIAEAYITCDVIELYQGDQLKTVVDYSNDRISPLIPNTSYTIKFKYYYTDDDGKIINDAIVKDFKTNEYFIPDIYIDYATDTDAIIIEPIFFEYKDKIEVESVILYHNDTEVQRLKNLNHWTFYNVTPGLTYRVDINYKCKINSQECEKTSSKNIIMPINENNSYARAINIEVEYNKVKFDLFESDPNNQVDVRKISLYLDGEEIKTLEDFEILEFNGLYSYKRYAIVVFYTVTNDEGIRYYDRYTFFNTPEVPNGKANIDIVINDKVISYTFDYDVKEAYRGITKVQLYHYNQFVKEFRNLESGVIDGWDFGEEYQLRIQYKCYFNSYENDVRTLEIRKDFKTPLEYQPTVYLINIVCGYDSISFDIRYDDPSKVIMIDYLYVGDERGNGQRFEYGSLPKKVDGLLSNHFYELYIPYTYFELDEKKEGAFIYNFYTLSYDIPIIDAVINVNENIINGELLITDNHDLGYLKSIKLYCNNELIAFDNNLDDSVFSFDNLENGTFYIEIKYAYDLNEGIGEEIIKKKYELNI